MSLVWYMRVSFWNFGICVYNGDKNQNTDLFQITCFKQHNNMAVEENLRGMINFYEKHCLPVFHMEQK